MRIKKKLKDLVITIDTKTFGQHTFVSFKGYCDSFSLGKREAHSLYLMLGKFFNKEEG